MLFRFLFRNLKGDYVLVVFALLVTIALVGFNILIVLPILYILNKIQFPFNPAKNPPAILNPLISPFDRFATAQDQAIGIEHSVHTTMGVIVFSVVYLIVFIIFSAILISIQFYLVSLYCQNLSAKQREQIFEHLQRLSLAWHGKQKRGDIVQRITTDITNIERFASFALVDLFTDCLTIVGVTAVMLLINWQFALLSLAMVLVFYMIVLGYRKVVKDTTQAESRDADQVANIAAEDIGAIMVSKAFMLEERESLRFKRYVGKNREARLRVAILQARYAPFINILGSFGLAIIIFIAAYVAAGHYFSLWFLSIPAFSITIATGLLFLLYIRMLVQPILDLLKSTNLVNIAKASAERIEEVLNQAPEVIDSTAPYYGPTKLRGDITFENVKFGYTQDHFILDGINLHIPAGRKIALVGFPGCGKTTLVKLIPRFYEVQQGSVKIDGTDNRAYPLAILRQNVCLVPQDSVLFEGTIRENIAVGRPRATDREIAEAAKRVYMHDIIMTWPEGYETKVPALGKNLLSGQSQRLSIARAILSDPSILILDEPTTNLTAEDEAEFMRTLDTLIVGRTVLIITHHFGMLNNMDEIIVLKDGLIVEQGTFKELKQKEGLFARLLEE